MTSSPYKLTATQVLELLKNNAITVEAYARSLLNRIKENDGTVKVWAHLGKLLPWLLAGPFANADSTSDLDLVLSQARALDQIPKDQRGPLHGLAIGVKDIMDTKDCPRIAILRAAGALIFGKTTTTEFAVTNSGPETTNPHDPSRTPGGSSCGSAAAVADLQVTLSLGAQSGGSLIRPASYTGVFAMKPTFNTISTAGSKPIAPTFDTLGFFARSVEDLQLLADAFALQDDEPPRDIPLDETSVALIETPMWSSAGPGTVSAMKQAAAILQKNNVKVEKVSLPPEVADVEALGRIQRVITHGEAQVSFLREYRVNKANLAAEIRDMVENTSNNTHKEMTEACDTYSKMRDMVNKLAENYTAILTPSAVDEAPIGLGDMGSPTFNTLWTLSASVVSCLKRSPR
ncbi:hypothetical protein MRS44_007305 [Fusarium solani]|uniref:uncharacterized protein n=1 Tax=Fusarium solani TaxID=169388 RepID=UPI0032C4906A|nr:hypothetical protein MRS44_007305 [Fusarium solani]